MNGLWYGRLAVVALALHAVIAPRLTAGEPTVETLIANVPVLSPKNEGSQAFHVPATARWGSYGT